MKLFLEYRTTLRLSLFVVCVSLVGSDWIQKLSLENWSEFEIFQMSTGCLGSRVSSVLMDLWRLNTEVAWSLELENISTNSYFS